MTDNTDTGGPPKIAALDLPEIRRHVLQYLGGTNLVNCMQLNKAWQEEAVPVLWSRINLNRPPPIAELRRSGSLIRTLNMGYLDVAWPVYSTLEIPNLRGLAFSFVPTNGDKTSELFQRHTLLTQVDLWDTKCTFEGSAHASQLWEAMASLPNLRKLNLLNFTLTDNIDLLPPLSNLQSLVMQHVDFAEMSLNAQMQLMARCPALEILEWKPTLKVSGKGPIAIKLFARMVKAGTWPKLQGLTLGWSLNGCLDEDIASILEAMPRVSILALPASKFGPLSFEKLRAHFLTLRELGLEHSHRLTKAMVTEVLASCPRLSSASWARLTVHPAYTHVSAAQK
ncbi:hypothetical protein BC939DRAFT_506275 [Gamsiella multidivaricata]|uniref:uncharacterized protein n=1 Tax=Gamsiella multidivaricata TaxID=101098 RepID=UPI00221EAC1C|nr:uncharacterized protein BC939DRAFT_506275 [Gamsiella multidivaricata]KAG0369754.1 hypothetical protein BGZ54_009019 [Gamsiella multidivaricata]KAI7818793.1 hypothetical protein BC939DRAFT_506275 [Gamsiella multidivaricata]